jgi:hypothetical protein
MFEKPSDVPVLFLVYNRPAFSEQVFNKIREFKPKTLFINADGPKNKNQADIDLVNQTREIVEKVDWECNLSTNFMDINKGCKDAVSEGLNWFFNHVDAGIILEDDCLPNLSFFDFCHENLNYHWHNASIMQICGTNIQKTWNRNNYSYAFSKYGNIWGWATWRRAWKLYDKDMIYWPEIRDSKFFIDMCNSVDEALRRKLRFDKVYYNITDTWDTQWQFTKLSMNGLNIIPRVNMIKNIGFETDMAAHGNRKRRKAFLPTYDLKTPLNHPPFIIRDRILEKKDLKHKMKQGPLWYFKNIFKYLQY